MTKANLITALFCLSLTACSGLHWKQQSPAEFTGAVLTGTAQEAQRRACLRYPAGRDYNDCLQQAQQDLRRQQQEMARDQKLRDSPNTANRP